MSRLRGEFAETIDTQFQGSEAAFFISHDTALVRHLMLDVYQQQQPDERMWLAKVATTRIKQQIKQAIYPQSHILRLRELLQQHLIDLQDTDDDDALFFVVEASQLLAWIDKKGACLPPENLLKPGVSVDKLWHNYQLLGFDSRNALLLSDHPLVLRHLISAQYCQYMFIDQAALAYVAYMRLTERCEHDSDALRENLKNILETFCHYYPDELDCERYRRLLFQLDDQNCLGKLAFEWFCILDQHRYHPYCYADSKLDEVLTVACYLTHSKQAQKLIQRVVCYRLTQVRYQQDHYSPGEVQSYLNILRVAHTEHELLTWFDHEGLNPFPQHWIDTAKIEAIWMRLCALEFGGSRLSMYQSSHPLVLRFLTPEFILNAHVREAACWHIANPQNREQNPQRCKVLFEALSPVYQQHGLEMSPLKEDVYFKSSAIDACPIYKPSQVCANDVTLLHYQSACGQTRFCIEWFVLDRLMHFIYVDQDLKQSQLDIYLQILHLSLYAPHYHNANTIKHMRFVAGLFNQNNQYDPHGLAIAEIEFLCDIHMLDSDVSVFHLLQLPIDEGVYLSCGYKTQVALGEHTLKLLTSYVVQQQNRLIAESHLPMLPQISQDAVMLKRILHYHYQDLLWMRPCDTELHSLCLEVLKVLDYQGCYDSQFMMHWSAVVQAYLGDKQNLYVGPDQSPWIFDGSRTIHPHMTHSNFIEGSFRRRHMFVLAAVRLLEQRLESRERAESTLKLLHLIDVAICDPLWCMHYPQELMDRIDMLLQNPFFAEELVAIYFKQLQLPDVSDEVRCLLIDKIIEFAPVNEFAATLYARHAKQMLWLFSTGLIDDFVDIRMYCQRLLVVSLYEFLKFDNWHNHPQLCDDILLLISRPTERQLMLQAKPYLNRQLDFLKMPVGQQFYAIKCAVVDNCLASIEKGGVFSVRVVFEYLSNLVLELLDYTLLCDAPLPELLFKRIDLLHDVCQKMQDSGNHFVRIKGLPSYETALKRSKSQLSGGIFSSGSCGHTSDGCHLAYVINSV